MFLVLSNQHYQHRTNQKLRSWANAVFQNRWVCGQAVPSFPSPSPVIPFFFLLSFRRSRRTRAEKLATQAMRVGASSLLALLFPSKLIEEGVYTHLLGSCSDSWFKDGGIQFGRSCFAALCLVSWIKERSIHLCPVLVSQGFCPVS